MSDAKYYDQTSDNQPIGVKMRPGLQVQEITYQSEPWWVVKDPYDQQYHRYNEQEFAILNWLDGKVSFYELREKFERKFSPYRVSYSELITLIREFFKKSVIVSTQGGNGLQLHEHAREKGREKLKKKAKSLFAIQWQGWDPTWFIDKTYPLVGWFFSKAVVRLNALFILSALGWLLFHYDQFLNRLPNLWTLFDSSNLIALAAMICVTKILHELGHAYVHKRFGGECHEIGIMIFFFVPTLYCNTSDSWMMPNKWKRMAIGAAGVYVELVIFSIATYLWWFSGVGLLQDICLNLMVICSISAALTNGNPLMRYDGYFVLSDWLEIPNLPQKSGQEIRRLFLNKCLGIEREVDHLNSTYNKRVYLIYGLASFLYKTFLITVISFFLIQRFQPTGLGNVGLVIALISLSALFVQPIKSLRNYFKRPGSSQHVRRKPLLLTLGIAAMLLAAIIFVPLPFYVPGECTVVLTNQQTIFAPSSARIETVLAQPGEAVEQGQPIVQLISTKLEEEILQIESELEEINLRLKYQIMPSLSEDAASASSKDSFAKLSTTRLRLANELQVLQTKQDNLLVRAPRAGIIYGLTIGKRQADTDDDNLNRIYGNPLDLANQGGWLERGDEICRIGEESKQEITLLIEQNQNGLIHEGQEVTVLLSSFNQRLSGRIVSISLRENRADDLPESIYQESSAPMVLQVKQAANADKRKDIEFKDGQTLTSTMMQATVELTDAEAQQLNFASVGKARVFIGYRTLLWRLNRMIGELFQRSF